MKNFLPVILIIVSIGLSYFYLRPQYYKVMELRAESQDYDEVIEKSEELREIRVALAEKLDNFPQLDLDRIEKMIPKEVDTVRLILDMNNIAVKHGIIMRSIETEEVSEGPARRGQVAATEKPYKTMSVSFQFESLYNNLSPFLEEIEESLRIMDVVSVNISPNDSQPILHNYNLVIHTYWLND